MQVPAHAPVTVNVTVRFELLSATVPANVIVRVVPELVRYPFPPVVSRPLVKPLMLYDVLPFDRDSVSVAVAGTVAGSSASANVALKVSTVACT